LIPPVVAVAAAVAAADGAVVVDPAVDRPSFVASANDATALSPALCFLVQSHILFLFPYFAHASY
jgi:hypothetical protein